MEVDTTQWSGKQGDSSAVIEMQTGDDQSDYGDFNQPNSDYHSDDDDTRQRKSGQGFVDDMKEGFTKNMSSMLWQSGREKAQQAFTSYAKIDILRPYFDVEPNEVLKRLMVSFLPSKPSGNPQKIPSELYGPTMLIFTLVALLLFQMKVSNHQVNEGTLMGSAIGVCFFYWLGTSALIWTMAYVCNTHIRGVQILSLLGYSLSGHCVVIFLGTIVHTTHSHLLFYLLWAIFGGVCTLRMVSVLVSRTPGTTQRMVICGIVAALHLLFLLYLHFAYHQVVEAIDKLEKPAINNLEKPLKHAIQHVTTVPKLPHKIVTESAKHVKEVVRGAAKNIPVKKLVTSAVEKVVAAVGAKTI
ncbi:protein YIPF3-like isoform X2 [Lineus longissimus]|uniref:protein YIPF3-like isoform X2 n=1 Tax=Lineus longissimus TaxID=88925 RepID=UPI00315C51F2